MNNIIEIENLYFSYKKSAPRKDAFSFRFLVGYIIPQLKQSCEALFLIEQKRKNDKIGGFN